MSAQDVEVVREHLAPHEGEEVLPVIKALLDRIGPDPRPEAVLATLADDPGWRLTDRDIEWDMSATGMGGVAHGVRELAVWWGVWVAVWSSQSYRMREYRDMGDAVLTVADVHATARGYSVDPEIFQVWQVKDGNIVLMRAFLSEADALKAVQKSAQATLAPDAGHVASGREGARAGRGSRTRSDKRPPDSAWFR